MKFLVALSCLVAVTAGDQILGFFPKSAYPGLLAPSMPGSNAHLVGPPTLVPIAFRYSKSFPIGSKTLIPLASEARLVDPVAIAAGAPLPTGDTVEVAAAKAAHYQAHDAARAVHLASEARLVDPVAIAAGAPLPTGDTVEVAAAKAAHYQAHDAARAVHSAGRYKRSPGFVIAPITYGYSPYDPAHMAYSGLMSPYYG